MFICVFTPLIVMLSSSTHESQAPSPASLDAALQPKLPTENNTEGNFYHVDCCNYTSIKTDIKNLETLYLYICHSHPEDAIVPLSLFTNVENLFVFNKLMDPCTAPVEPGQLQKASVKLNGCLYFHSLEQAHDKLLEFVNEHSSGVHSISAYYCQGGQGLQKLFDDQGHNLSSVGIGPATDEEYPISLKSCTQLRTLSIRLLDDFTCDNRSWKVLDTIAPELPRRLNHITIKGFKGWSTEGKPEHWKEIDDSLCKIYGIENQKDIEPLVFCLHSYPFQPKVEDRKDPKDSKMEDREGFDDLETVRWKTPNDLMEFAKEVLPKFSKLKYVTLSVIDKV